MLNDIYNKRIIELAGNIPRLGRLARTRRQRYGAFQAVRFDREGRSQNGRTLVTDFAHDVKACALGQASSSVMARHVVGSTADELRELRETVRKMLKENGSPPQGKWADIALLEPVRDYKARHASTMLTFDAVVDAIGQIEAKAKQPVSAQGWAKNSYILPSCPRTRHPVRHKSQSAKLLGVLDHPLSRMMTPCRIRFIPLLGGRRRCDNAGGT